MSENERERKNDAVNISDMRELQENDRGYQDIDYEFYGVFARSALREIDRLRALLEDVPDMLESGARAQEAEWPRSDIGVPYRAKAKAIRDAIGDDAT